MVEGRVARAPISVTLTGIRLGPRSQATSDGGVAPPLCCVTLAMLLEHSELSPQPPYFMNEDTERQERHKRLSDLFSVR